MTGVQTCALPIFFSELRHTATTQAVKVPLSDAVWSTWRRYCEAIGLTMGEGIAGLIDHELGTVVGETTGADDPVFAGRDEQQIVAREEAFAIRERDLKARMELLRGREKRLRSREGELRALEQQVRAAASQTPRPTERRDKVGRNERCPCGSGLKYKHCHGLAGR